MLSILGFENGEMQMSAGRMPRISRETNPLADGNGLSNLNLAPAFLEMNVVAHGSI